MRLAYLDEAGISRGEPAISVAGVVVHGDTELTPLEKGLGDLLLDFSHQHGIENPVYSTKDAWSGTKIFKGIDRSYRLSLIHRYVDLIVDWQLTIPNGYVSRDWLMSIPRSPDKQQRDIDVAGQTLAYLCCLMAIEVTARKNWQNEVVQIVFENNNEARRMMHIVHEGFRKPDPAIQQYAPDMALNHVRTSIHFVGKNESMLMHLADVCAFFTRGHLAGRSDIDPFFDRLKPFLVSMPE